MTDKADWLARLRVGDWVIVRTWPYDNRHRQRVSRFTKTLIVTDDDSRYRRKDGYVPGDLWRMNWLEKPTATQARKANR